MRAHKTMPVFARSRAAHRTLFEHASATGRVVTGIEKSRDEADLEVVDATSITVEWAVWPRRVDFGVEG